jgi:prepilin-type N-terminal cleavage/methylation domain-containing protein
VDADISNIPPGEMCLPVRASGFPEGDAFRGGDAAGSTVFLLKHNGKHGFTLLELLASMAILSLLVLLMARIFAETTDMWTQGTRRVSSATEGRVVMDFLVREMSMAIADEIVAFKLNSDSDKHWVPPGYSAQSYTQFEAQSDEVAFVAMVRPGSSGWRRTANQFVYFVAPMLDEDRQEMPGRFRLVRTRRTTTLYNNAANREAGPYGRPPALTGNRFWWQEMAPDWLETGNPALRSLETIAENVAAFEIWAWSENQNRYVFSYDSINELNLLPLWLDIYLEMLGEDQAIQAAALWAVDEPAARGFVEANAQRYTARVYFPNRERALAFRE